MSRSDVISINPSKATPGSLNADIAIRLARKLHPANISYGWKTFLNLTFACGRSNLQTLPYSLLFLRIVFTGVLIFVALHGNYRTPDIVVYTAAGIMLSGFLTRISAIACTIIMAVFAFVPSGAMDFSVCDLMTAFAFLVFVFTGSGKFSADSIIRFLAIKALKNKKKRQADKSLSDGHITLDSIR